MEIRTLKYFLAIAREENMTAAANTMHVSQSALSRQLQDLEQEVGKQLFTRTSKKMVLTSDGIHLRKRAEEIVALIERTESEMQYSNNDIYGDIYIGAGETQNMKYIANAIRRTQKRYPQIQFHIYSGTAVDVSERLDHGSLDFGLLFEPVFKENYQYISIPYKDQLGVLVQKNSPYAEYQNLSAKDLLEMPLITTGRTDLNAMMASWARDSKYQLTPMATYNLVYNAARLVEAGIGNALTIEGLVNTTGNSLLKFIPLNPPVKMEMIFAWKQYHPLTAAAEIFLDEIRKEFTF